MGAALGIVASRFVTSRFVTSGFVTSGFMASGCVSSFAMGFVSRLSGVAFGGRGFMTRGGGFVLLGGGRRFVGLRHQRQRAEGQQGGEGKSGQFHHA